MRELTKDVGEWAKATFPEQTSARIARHMREEVGELLMEDSIEEVADVTLLLMSWLAHHSLTYDDWLNAVEARHRRNERSTFAFNPLVGFDKRVGG